MEKLTELKNIGYEEIIEFMDFLDERHGDSAFNMFLRFFVDLKLEEELTLVNFFEYRNKDLYESMQSEFNIKFNRKGDSEVKTNFNWEMTLKVIEDIYEDSKEKNITSIIEAKELSIIKNFNHKSTPGTYYYNRKKFLNNHPQVQKQLIIQLEKNLSSLNEGKQVGNFLLKVYELIDKGELDLHFLDHFTKRVYILTKDEDLTNSTNKEFKETLLELLDENNNL